MFKPFNNVSRELAQAIGLFAFFVTWAFGATFWAYHAEMRLLDERQARLIGEGNLERERSLRVALAALILRLAEGKTTPAVTTTQPPLSRGFLTHNAPLVTR